MRPNLKPRPCKHCKAEYTPRTSLQAVCSIPCAIESGKAKNAQKAAREARKAIKAEARETARRKQALKTPQQLKSKAMDGAEKAARRYVRIRDNGKGCISCGKTEEEVESGPYRPGGYWDAGHFISKASRPELRLNVLQINRQCKTCNGGTNNIRYSGTAKAETVKAGYKRRLIDKIGEDYVAWLEGPHPPMKAEIDYLDRYKRIFNKRAQKLEKGHVCD